MPQRLKDEVRTRILAAALKAFADAGFAAATMAEIALSAGISTGNLYRYFESKEALLLAAVPPTFVEELSRRFGVRLEASRGVRDLRELAPGHPYLFASEELLAYCIANRLRVVAVLGRGQGTRYAGFRAALVQRLVGAAVAHYAPGGALPETLRFGLEEVYENYVGSLVRMLAHFEEPTDVRAAVDRYQRYHLVGLDALFA